jgi:hypothetical protein
VVAVGFASMSKSGSVRRYVGGGGESGSEYLSIRALYEPSYQRA